MTLHRLKDHKYIDYPWWIVTCLVLQARQAGTSLPKSAVIHAHLGSCFATTPLLSSTMPSVAMRRSHAGISAVAGKDAQKLLMLARGMAKKRLDSPETANQYTKGGPESGEAVRLYVEVLKVISENTPVEGTCCCLLSYSCMTSCREYLLSQSRHPQNMDLALSSHMFRVSDGLAMLHS